MWLLILFFFFCVSVLSWVLFGYYIWIFFMGILFRKNNPEDSPKGSLDEEVTMIVPTYNEAGFIVDKIKNIEALDYSKDKLKVIFVDGNSEDGTADLIRKHLGAYMKLIQAPARGKIHQLNHALAQCRGGIVIVSDADALLTPNTIREFMSHFLADSDIYLIGAYSSPSTNYDIDRYYWMSQNKGRLMETRAFSSSIIVATCYAFRRGALDAFPEDVIADDVYLSYVVNNRGKRVIYTDRCQVSERRAPRNMEEFLSHKLRKSNAFLRESLRFLYKASEMNPVWRIMFLTKIMQMLMTPWIFSFYLVTGLALLFLGGVDVFLVGTAILVILLWITSCLFAVIPNLEEKKNFGFMVTLKTFLLSVFILFLCASSFTFFRQTSSYQKTNA